MHVKFCALLALLLVASCDIVLGKNGNKTKIYKKLNNVKEKSGDRIKRALNDDDGNPFWPNRGKKLTENLQYNNNLNKGNSDIVYGTVEKEPPFWATRGRRDFSGEKNDVEYIESDNNDHNLRNNLFCKDCLPAPLVNYNNEKVERDQFNPFWGNRGRRDSNEDLPSEPFWGNRGKKQKNKPFRRNRSRKLYQLLSLLAADSQKREDEPFWGTRGRREDSPFWGNRGRREDEPFWGNRGRRQDSEPFWGNRGRRQESEPFWGNRGRREDSEPFWGNRGRRTDSLRIQNREKEDLKESILSDLNMVENDIENLARLKRSKNSEVNSFWGNRGRNSQLNFLFNGPTRSRVPITPNLVSTSLNDESIKASEPGTLLDGRIYAEQPHYILVERSSRSSAEEDPFYISRGKKYYINYNLAKAARDRRGAIEEIVKSVRNDPYYIARGKKDSEIVRHGNSTNEELLKARDLVCDAIQLIVMKNENSNVKREINDNDRDRRTILKKLAAQLQIDPYFVSRGKKSGEAGAEEDNLRDFINDVAEKCN